MLDALLAVSFWQKFFFLNIGSLSGKMTEKAYNSSSSFPALAPGTMRLYSMRFCPFAERTRLVLAHKNIKHQTINIDLKEKPSWFLERNPNGTVPVLEHDGKVISESLITAEYLDDLYPQNKLTPSDPYKKAQDKLVVEMFSKVTSLFYKLFKDSNNEDVKKFHDALEKIEKVLAERGTPFFGGQSVQMADLMIWVHVERFPAVAKLKPETELAPDRFPKFTQWIKTMESVPAVKKCRWDADTYVHFFESSKTGKPDFDYGL